jgi:hypothetical protein
LFGNDLTVAHLSRQPTYSLEGILAHNPGEARSNQPEEDLEGERVCFLPADNQHKRIEKSRN